VGELEALIGLKLDPTPLPIGGTPVVVVLAEGKDVVLLVAKTGYHMGRR
jgi:hypothetical protein